VSFIIVQQTHVDIYKVSRHRRM